MAIEIVDFPIKNGDFPIKKGDFPWQNVRSPEGIHQHQSQLLIGRHQLCIAPNALAPAIDEAACGEAALLLPLEFSVSHVIPSGK